jgi:two-component system chemotaxis response regulator CheY
MEKLNIVCIDDQREVLTALRKDLDQFKSHCQIEECESAAEASEVMNELDAAGEHVAVLICDHVMPGKNGIDFLIEVNQDLRFAKTKKLLLTGMATHQDTIVAINKAHIDRYIEKPWDIQNLTQTLKSLLTMYVIEAGIEYQPFLEVLDQGILYRELRGKV